MKHFIFKNQKSNNNTVAQENGNLNMLLSEPTATTRPNADLRNRRIDFYFEDDKVLIEGLADIGYTFWLSKTDITDISTNAKICQHILHDFVDVFYSTNKYYDGLTKLFKKSILRIGDFTDSKWATPFGTYIGDDDKTGLFIAKSLVTFKSEIDKLCEAREDGGNYLSVMQAFLERLSQRTDDPILDYTTAAPWIKIMEDEDYLLCSKNEQIRELYLQLLKQYRDLHSRYMTEVR
ncbi:hypothetical protein [Butyrivibrio sp. NC3005]|uniref:hypothetical protein n=1 Tax=Butyrivibrio sp. NC3005 TaxID=1280685 RepID=UPI000417A78A|nr:hypothetical protein [Butyrivibrio sp. NC3005]